MGRLIDNLLDWLPWRRWEVVAFVDAADEIPDVLPRYGAVVVGDRKLAKWVAFDCPCRRGHRIMLPLDPRQRTHWKLGVARRLTVSPSVDAHDGGHRCHYFMRDGRARWCD